MASTKPKGPKRRLEVANPPNPYSSDRIEYVRESEWDPELPVAKLDVFEEEAKSALSKNTSPDVGFTWSVNPYRGCFHGCAYCYARPTHQYLGHGAGTDFERKLIVKTNIAECLRKHFDKRSWAGETIVFSGNTDCYQPIEGRYGLTRACLELCAEYRNPVCVITKSKLVARDVDVLQELHEFARCHVTFSVPFIDGAMARAIEPNAPSPRARLAAMKTLADAGIPVGLSLGPIIPGLSEEQIPAILEAARDAGASWAFGILLRLPREVLPVFDERLQANFPMRAKKVRSALEEMRLGNVQEARFGQRMRGHGPRWQTIERLFELHRKRLGLVLREPAFVMDGSAPTTFRRPETPKAQLTLF